MIIINSAKPPSTSSFVSDSRSVSSASTRRFSVSKSSSCSRSDTIDLISSIITLSLLSSSSSFRLTSILYATCSVLIFSSMERIPLRVVSAKAAGATRVSTRVTSFILTRVSVVSVLGDPDNQCFIRVKKPPLLWLSEPITVSRCEVVVTRFCVTTKAGLSVSIFAFDISASALSKNSDSLSDRFRSMSPSRIVPFLFSRFLVCTTFSNWLLLEIERTTRVSTFSLMLTRNEKYLFR